MLPVRAFIPNVEGLQWLHTMFQKHQSEWHTDLPKDPIEFVAFVAGTTSACFTVGESNQEPIGLFLFTDISPGDACFSHVFIWDKAATTTKDLVLAARYTITAMMEARDLFRVNGLIPTDKPEVRAFAQLVGFKHEGTLEKVLKVHGERKDAYLMAITAERMASILKAPNVIE